MQSSSPAKDLMPRVDPSVPATGQIVTILRDAILRLDLRPGQALSEGDLAVALGASRTPVRAALQELRDQGLVETRPSRGTFVTPFDADRLRGAQFLREALELATVGKLAQGRLPEAGVIEENLAAQALAVTAADAARFHVLDDEFHSLLASATGFPRVASVLAREKAQLDRLRMVSLRDKGRLAELLAEHRRIFDAVRARDGTAAIEAMRAHVRSVLGVLDDLARDHAAFFKGEPE